MENSYKIDMNNVFESQVEWINELCRYIRETEVPFYYDIENVSNHRIHGYIVTRNGNFGLILNNDSDDNTFRVMIAKFVLSHSPDKKFVTVLSKADIMITKVIQDANNIPDFVDLNAKLKAEHTIYYTIYAVYINTKILVKGSFPPVSYSGNRDEWVEDEGLIPTLKIQIEV